MTWSRAWRFGDYAISRVTFETHHYPGRRELHSDQVRINYNVACIICRETPDWTTLYQEFWWSLNPSNISYFTTTLGCLFNPEPPVSNFCIKSISNTSQMFITTPPGHHRYHPPQTNRSPHIYFLQMAPNVIDVNAEQSYFSKSHSNLKQTRRRKIPGQNGSTEWLLHNRKNFSY